MELPLKKQWKGQFLLLNEVRCHSFRCKKISIETEVPMPIDMDGEFDGFSPMVISLQHKINVVVRNDREV